MTTVYSPIAPITPVERDEKTIGSRLHQAFPSAYRVALDVVREKRAVLCGSVVAAASHCSDEDWEKVLPLLKESDLDVFFPGEDMDDWSNAVHEFASQCTGCYWYKRGRVVELVFGTDRVQLIHTGTTGPRAGCLSTDLEVLDSFDMTHLQVGFHPVHGSVSTGKYGKYLVNGTSQVVSPDVLIKRIKKNVARGYPVSVDVEVNARSLQGYDGNNWKTPAPHGESLNSHLCGAPVDPMDENIKPIAVCKAMNMDDRVPEPVKYQLDLKLLDSAMTALKWLQENRLSESTASAFWEVAMMRAVDSDECQWVDKRNGRVTPASVWSSHAHLPNIASDVLEKVERVESLEFLMGPYSESVTITPLNSDRLPATFRVDPRSSTGRSAA